MTTDLGPIQRPKQATLLSPIFPSYATVKKDGIFVRWICTRVANNYYRPKLYTRTGNPIEGFQLPYFVSSKASDVVQFDTECVGPDGMSFEELNGIVRARENSKKASLIFYAFDYVDKSPYPERLKKLEEFVSSITYSETNLVNLSLRVLPLELIRTRLDLIRFLNSCAAAGEEGVILKDTLSSYIAGKTWASQKIKFLQDDEFLIVDIKEQTGQRDGCALFVCKAGNRTFTCTLNATVEEQRRCLADKDTLIGQHLTVQYLSLSPEGVPRQPKGKGIRIDKDKK